MAHAKAVPDHVPAHLVYDYDRYATPSLWEAPQFGLARTLREEAPPIFYSPTEQMWVAHTNAAVSEIARRYDLFTSDFANKLAEIGIRPLPTHYDPPEHSEMRMIITPAFTPKAIAVLEPQIRAVCRRLFDSFYDRGEADFVSEFAQVFPIEIFLTFVNAPREDAPRLVNIVERYLRTADHATSLVAGEELIAYLRTMIAERRGDLGDDIISSLIRGTFCGRPLTESEVLGGSFLTFLAGLDTVAAALSFVVRFLARNPGHYAQLVADPGRIQAALEELLRVAGVAMPERAAASDFEYEGVPFKKDDRILLMSSISGMDAEMVDEPERIDFDRKVSRHAIFGYGAHRCLGSHLARAEMKIFLEEFVRRFPKLAIQEGAEVKVLGGVVWIPAALPIVWPVEPGNAA